ANACSAISNHLSISVYPMPPVSISVKGDTLRVYDALNQQWYLNDSAISGATSNTYIANRGGSYTVEITDSNGCIALSNPVIVSEITYLSNDDVVNVYPNPTAQEGWQLSISSNLLGGLAEVFDADGRVVFLSKIRNHKSEIKLNVASGVYVL